jgi:hypothetical protein
MSFSVYVKARAGKAEVERVYGEVPDGTYIVNGHDHDGEQHLGVTVQRERGRPVKDAPQA